FTTAFTLRPRSVRHAYGVFFASPTRTRPPVAAPTRGARRAVARPGARRRGVRSRDQARIPIPIGSLVSRREHDQGGGIARRVRRDSRREVVAAVTIARPEPVSKRIRW